MPLEPEPTHVVAHVSDSHFTASGVLHDTIPTGATFAAALAAVERTGVPIDVLVHTGDVADTGETAAYATARSAICPVLERTGWRLVVCVGNHDLRAPLREHLLGLEPSDAPLDTVTEVRGLRILGLDTAIPGRVEGRFDEDRIAWLRDVLREPAEHGTVLALHHPPVPVDVSALQAFHLTHAESLAAAIAGTDVRAVLGGHLHYGTASVFAGVPVFVAPATSYTIGVRARGAGFASVDGGRAAGLLSLYADGRIGYTLVATDPLPVVAETDEHAFDTMGVHAPG